MDSVSLLNEFVFEPAGTTNAQVGFVMRRHFSAGVMSDIAGILTFFQRIACDVLLIEQRHIRRHVPVA